MKRNLYKRGKWLAYKRQAFVQSPWNKDKMASASWAAHLLLEQNQDAMLRQFLTAQENKEKMGERFSCLSPPCPWKNRKTKGTKQKLQSCFVWIRGFCSKMLTPITVVWVQGLSFTMQQQKVQIGQVLFPHPVPFPLFLCLCLHLFLSLSFSFPPCKWKKARNVLWNLLWNRSGLQNVISKIVAQRPPGESLGSPQKTEEALCASIPCFEKFTVPLPFCEWRKR